MTGSETLVRARRIVTPKGERAADVLLRAGRITRVTGYGSEPATPALDVPDDCVLLPGLVDSHVHVNEPGRTGWEGFVTATAAAAAGGVTTVVDMPLNRIPPTIDVSALGAKQAAAAGRIAVDVGFWGGAIPGNLNDLQPLHEAGVAGFKCFLLPSGVDEFPPLDQEGLTEAMRRIASFGGLLIAHAEAQPVIDAAPRAAGPSYAGFLASRPPEAETAAIENLLATTRRTGCRTHIVHLSAAAALPLVQAAKDEGLPLTVETCPHYLTLEAGQVPDGATSFKCCPPVRDAANREQLWQALGEGLIDCVVSDHSPCTPELKAMDTGDFGAAWGGIASLQVSLPAVWTEAASRGFGLPDLVRWMCPGPARLAGLAGKGAIAPGYDADLVVLAPDESMQVDPRTLRQRNPVTPICRRYPSRGGASNLAGRRANRRRPAEGPAAAADGAVSERLQAYPELANRALGGTVVWSNDEFYCEADRLLVPDPPVHDPAEFTTRGKVYDGWETRRRRDPAAGPGNGSPGATASDHAIVRLATPAVVHLVDIDTAFFRGNYPPHASVEGVAVLGYPTAAELLDADWFPLVERTDIGGDGSNVHETSGPERLVTHVRLSIYPDGGVARLRVYGEARPDPRFLGGRIDLASTVHGGRVVACSNMFYSSPSNVLAPGRAAVMSDGWETARRRDDGNDWLVVQLGSPGELHDVVIDTLRFVGNAPGWAALSDADTGADLLPRTPLLPDMEHRFRLQDAGTVRRVRLDIYPDGGISRLRVHGAVSESARAGIGSRWLELLGAPQAATLSADEFFA